MDLGLKRAGWHTVSFSEIDPYASAVLAERWPGVPNLGSIVGLADRWGRGQSAVGEGLGCGLCGSELGHREGCPFGAHLWSGGFPCQDLSVAGKRRGMGSGTRSGLAFAFLDLVRVYRPPLILLENVPGLLSSHGGKDMAVLLGTMVELGYGVAYRVLDARYFGVPQRRRRVFIVGVTPGGRAGAERAAEVLSVGSRCRRHPPTGIEAGPEPAERVARSVTGSSGKHHDPDTDTYVTQALRSNPYADHVGDDRKLILSAAPDPHGVREADGLAGRLDGHPLDPPKIDSARYRCCGNGVVSDVAEWIGRRLME